jgi:hypothetical protein
VKKTAYERTKDHITPGMAEARRLLAASQDPIELLTKMFDTAVQTPHLDLGGVLAIIPYALAEKAAEAVEDPFIWDDFGDSEPMRVMGSFDLALGKMLHPNDPVLNQSWVSSSIINLWQYQCHRMAGEKVYELSLGLGERLLKTELHGLNTEDLRLPFRSIYLVIPSELGLKLVNEVTGEHDLEGVYITEYEHEGVRKWKFLFWGPPNANGKNEFDDTIFHFSVELPEGLTLEQAIENSEAFRRGVGTQLSAKFYLDHWRQLFTLVMNAVVYCTWPDAELRETQNGDWLRLQEQLRKHPKGSHKYERTREKLRQTPQQRRIVLGPTVKRFEGASHGGGGSLLVRTLVSGHWKRQVHGEGRLLRKWIFVSPFWRGPEEGPESNPRRVLEGV